MEVFDPNPSLKWLFCFTHPDDELSICAWIRRLTEVGAEVHLSWTHSTPKREEEARIAAGFMGVNSDRLTFFGAHDGKILDQLGELSPRFRDLIQTVTPDRIACGAFEQGHIDHDATHFLVHKNFTRPILEIPFYHAYFTRLQRLNRFANPRGESVLHLSSEETNWKKQAIKLYPSQNIRQIIVSYELLHFVFRREDRLARTERMRFCSDHDFSQPNLTASLNIKVLGTAAWQRWKNAISEWQEAHLDMEPFLSGTLLEDV